jgi:hypothetical protein
MNDTGLVKRDKGFNGYISKADINKNELIDG